MIEALKSDHLVKKVGGSFRLTALVQRRLKELVEGARPLVDTKGKTMVEVVIQEIDEDKIAIDYDRTEGLNPPDLAQLEKDLHSGVGAQESVSDSLRHGDTGGMTT